MRGEVLDVAVAREDDHLGHDGDGLAVNGKGPEHLHGRPAVVADEKGEDGARRDDELPVLERVLLLLVRDAPRLPEADHIHDGRGGEDVEDLHDGVVHGEEVGEEVEVAAYEDEEVQLLRLEGDA